MGDAPVVSDVARLVDGGVLRIHARVPAAGGPDDSATPARPPSPPRADDDADASPPRRKRLRRSDAVALTLRCADASSLDECGAQPWLASLLLADLLVHRRQSLRGRVVVELGSGIGIGALVAARFASTVVATDACPRALALCEHNAGINPGGATLLVRRLDWRSGVPSRAAGPRAGPFSWTESDLALLRQPGALFIAADVLYEPGPAAWFFATLRALLQASAGSSCWLAWEHRTNFSLDRLRPEVTCMEAFRANCDVGGRTPDAPLVAEELSVEASVPQYAQYDRSPQLRLYELRLRHAEGGGGAEAGASA